MNYKDSKKSYNLQRPSEWEQVEKAGADALFKAPNLRSTDLGVTVSPVRIKRLEQLGDVETVGNRLLAAEKKKVSFANRVAEVFLPSATCPKLNMCAFSRPNKLVLDPTQRPQPTAPLCFSAGEH